jgi:TorA maturation chaperone TorD
MTDNNNMHDASILRLEALASQAVEVSHLYGLLAVLFHEEVSAELLGTLRSEPMCSDLRDIGIEFDDEFLSMDEVELAERLAVEYTALFLGPGHHINTHESVQAEKDGYLWGERTVAVKRFIEGSGLSYADNFNGIPDHISVELEYLSTLTHFESQDWENERISRVVDCLKYQQDFLSRHLGAWYETFCDQVIERAGMPFYSQIAQLFRDFLSTEIADVEKRLEYAVKQLPEEDTDQEDTDQEDTELLIADTKQATVEAVPA